MTLKRMIDLLKEYLRMNNLELTDTAGSSVNIIIYYLDKIFIILSASFGTLSTASYATVVGIPVGITRASLTLIFTIRTGISKSLLKVTKKRKKET